MSNFAELASQIDAMDSQPEDKADSFASLANKIDSYQAPKGSAKSSDKGYFAKVAEAASKFQSAVDKGDITTAPKAVAESALGMATGAPIGLLKHGIEEGAYLSGQEPSQAQSTAERVLPINGYQPSSEAGQALSNLVSTTGQPLVDAGQWAAEKLGFSPSAQKIAGDFSPVVIPKAIAATPGAIRSTVGAVKDATGTVKSAAGNMNARFQELQRIGRGEPPLQPQSPVTPQVIRGQEPVAPEIAAQLPKEAPPLTIENASPALKQELQGLLEKTQLRHLEADSLPVPVQLTKGQATGDLAQLSDEFNMRGKQPELAQRFNEQNGKLIENVNAIRDRIAPDVSDVNHVDNGAALIDSYQKLNAAREAEVNANYKALADANEGSIPVDGKAFAQGVDKVLGNGLVNKREFLPASVEKIVQRIGESDQQMTFDDFTTLRTILAKEAMKATRAGDGNASHAISLVRDQLENIPMGPGAEALKPLADTAKNSAKALFKDIESDPAWDAAINGKVPPDSFVKKFVINAPRDYVSKMKTNIGADPIANQTISASVLNYLKERAGVPNDSGNFSQAGYNKALNAVRPKLDSLLDPVSAQQVETLGKVARYTQEQPRGSYFNNSNTFVSAAKNTAQAAAEGALNIKTMGLSGALKGALQAGKQSKAAAEALKPGAGVKISDLPK